MKVAIICFTEMGARQAVMLKLACETVELGKNDAASVEVYCKMSREIPMPLRHQGVRQLSGTLSEWTKEQFQTAELIIFIGAAGIAVRSIAPYIESKVHDPAVLVSDERGQFLISLLSGHLGGANEWARQIAKVTSTTPVITTASDINDRVAVDVLAQKNQCLITDMELAKHIAAAIVSGAPVRFACEGTIRDRQAMPANFVEEGEVAEYGVKIGFHAPSDTKTLWLIPCAIHIGIGCRKGKSCEDIEAAVIAALEELQLPIGCVCQLDTIDLKKDEIGLLEFSRKYSLPLYCYTAEELEATPGDYTPSDFVKQVTGVDNVCERAALCGCRTQNLILKKRIYDGITIAFGAEEWGIDFE